MALESHQRSQIIEAASVYKPKAIEKSREVHNLPSYRIKFLTFKSPNSWDYRYDYGLSQQFDDEHSRFTVIPSFLVQCAQNTDSFSEMRQISKHLVDPIRQTRGGAFNFISEIRSYTEAHQYISSLGNYLYLAADKDMDIRGTIKRNIQLALDRLKQDVKLPLKAQTKAEVDKLQSILNLFRGGSFVNQEMDYDSQEAKLRTEYYLDRSKPQVQEWRVAAFMSPDRNKKGLSVNAYVETAASRGNRLVTNYQELNSIAFDALSLTQEADKKAVLENVSHVFKRLVESDKGVFLGKDSFELGIYLAQYLKMIPSNLISDELIGNVDYIFSRLEKDMSRVPTETDFDYHPKIESNLTFLGKQLNSMRTYLIK